MNLCIISVKKKKKFSIILDAASLSSFEESSRNLKIKVEPDPGLPSQTYSEGTAPKPWPLDSVATSATLSDSRYSPQKEDPSTETSTSQSEITSTHTSSSVNRSPPMPQLYTQSVITEASTTSQNTTDQTRPLVRGVLTFFVRLSSVFCSIFKLRHFLVCSNNSPRTRKNIELVFFVSTGDMCSTY